MSSTLAEPTPLPKYLDLCQQFELQIESGELQPGDRLPSFVQMREQHGATAATVERLLRTLEQKGLIKREPYRGTFVTARARAKAKGVIGLLTQAVYRDHPYYQPLLRGAQDKAHELGIEVLLLMENSIISHDKVDGVLSIGAQDALLRQIPFGMPRVSLMGAIPSMSSVNADDGQGVAAAIDHLVELGHRRITFLTMGTLRYADAASRQRYQAYRESLKRHGIKPEPRWVKKLRDEYDKKVFVGFATAGREKMQQWLEEDWKKLGCTALLTQNDEVAIQVIQVLQENGYRVPTEVSVVGFDNTAFSTWIRPHLTTVDVGLEQIGACATQLLLETVAGRSASDDAPEANVLMLPTKLVVRESTGPAPVK
jgi:DNA-binding LacI/PurR family transcriptional regulator